MAETETAAPAEASEPGEYASHTHGGITSTSNVESSEGIKENLESEEKPLDGEPPDPEAEEKAKIAKAASDLGKKGGEATAAKPIQKLPEAEESEERKTSNRTTAKERVEQATQETAALRRERKQLIQERDEARARIKALSAPPAPKPNGEARDDPSDPPPDESQYEDTPEGARKFIRDEASHATRQEFNRQTAAREAKSKEAQNLRQREEIEERYDKYWEELDASHKQVMWDAYEADPQLGEKLDPEVASLIPSYVVKKEGGVVQYINAVADEIMRAKHAVPVMLYLSENPETFQRIAALRSPRDLVREVAIIDAKFLDAATPVPAKRAAQPSKAPPPITPVSGSPATADPTEVSDDMTTDEWMRRRQAADGRR